MSKPHKTHKKKKKKKRKRGSLFRDLKIIHDLLEALSYINPRVMTLIVSGFALYFKVDNVLFWVFLIIFVLRDWFPSS